MIYESGPWKDKLLRDAKRLRELMQPTRTSLRRWFAIEQVFFLSAFGMRKLWEAHKLSSGWGQRLVSCRNFALRAQTPTVLSWHKIDEYYDLGSVAKGTIKAPELCNLLIHSFVFVPEFNRKGGVAGVFFASHRSRRSQLIWLSARDYVGLLEFTGQNYPGRATFTANAGGQYDVWMDEGLPARQNNKRGLQSRKRQGA